MPSNVEEKNDICSIVIPVFNREKTVAETIKSCLDQSYLNVEIILVDDGSSDKSATICSQLANQQQPPGKLVKLVHQANSGACVARNRGMALATGTYLMFLDSDDTIPPQKILKQIAAIEQSGASCCISDFMTVDENGERIEIFKNDFAPTDFITRLKSPSNSAIVMRRSTVPATLQWNTSLSRMQDTDFMLRYLASVESWIYLPEPLYFYRIHNGARISDTYLQGMPYGSLFRSMYRHLLRNPPATTSRIWLLANYGLALMRAYLKDKGSRLLPIPVKTRLKRLKSPRP